LGAQVSDEEKEHLKQFVAKLKEKHTAEVLALARSSNSESSEGKIQLVIDNEIKTFNIKVEEPQEKMPNIKTQKSIKDEGTAKEESESEGQSKGADTVINWLGTLR
jgi:hypothetical protein